MRISDWSSDVCSSDLAGVRVVLRAKAGTEQINALTDRVEARLRAVPARFEDAFIDLLGGGPGGTSALAEGLSPVELASDVAVSCRDLTKRFGDFTATDTVRSEEHTSELQSLMRISYAVFCLKKNNS